MLGASTGARVACKTHTTALGPRQATVVAGITAEQTRPTARYLVCGDMNDGVDAAPLAPLTADPTLKLVNGLAGAVADRSAPKDNPPAPDRPWSDRFKESGKPAEYTLLDQIWLSP